MSFLLGGKHSPEARAKMSLAQTGRVMGEETRQRIRAAKLGVPHSESTKAKLRGDKNGRWKGGTTISGGYRMVYAPDSPMADATNRVFEHRLVMSAHVGRPLSPDEEVHHIDGDKLNNDISNLQLMSKRGHAQIRWLNLLAEMANLRATVAEQAETIESLRARLKE